MPAQPISIALRDISNRSRALAAVSVDHDPLLAAQLIQNCVKTSDWKYLVRKLIYDETNDLPSESLKSLARLCRLTPMLSGVINFNYDDLFERNLPSFGIEPSVLTLLNTLPKKGTLPVYHPHGWLPQGGGQDTDIVLSETDYGGQSATPYSWSNVIQIATYTSHTAVFVGCSMTDPHLRTLLRATAATKARPHFAFLPSSANRSDANRLAESLFDNDLVTMRIKPIRYPVSPIREKEHDALWYLLRLLGDGLEDESVLGLSKKKAKAIQTPTATEGQHPS